MGTDRSIAVDLLGMVVADVVLNALGSRARRRFTYQRQAAAHRVRARVELFAGATGIVLGAIAYVVVRRRAGSPAHEGPDRADGAIPTGAPALTT